MIYSYKTKEENAVKTVIGLISCIALLLIGGGIWGIYMAVQSFGPAFSLPVIGGIGILGSILIILMGRKPGRSVKNPFLSALAVFFGFFATICIFEGLLYDICLLISVF